MATFTTKGKIQLAPRLVRRVRRLRSKSKPCTHEITKRGVGMRLSEEGGPVMTDVRQVTQVFVAKLVDNGGGDVAWQRA